MHVAGTLASNSALTETMVRGKILNVLQIGAITVLIATIVLRSFLAGLLVAVPLAIAVLINFGVMGAADIRLDVATSAVTAMAVGIGADYAVYFLFRMREEYARDGDFAAALRRSLTTSGKAILFVSSAVGLGYSVLCLSGFRLFVQLGALVGLAMVTSRQPRHPARAARDADLDRTHAVDPLRTGNAVGRAPDSSRGALGRRSVGEQPPAECPVRRAISTQRPEVVPL